MTHDGRVHQTDEEQTVTLTATLGDVDTHFIVLVMPRQIERNLLLNYTFSESDVYTDGNQRMIRDHSPYGRDGKLMGSNSTVNGKLDLTKNSTTSFSTNGYVLVPSHLLDSLRSYTVMLSATPDKLANQPRFFDFGASSSNSFFLRANGFAAGFKYNNGTTTLLNADPLTEGTTYQLAVTFDAMTRTTTIYVDGTVVAQSQNIENEPYQIVGLGEDKRNYIGRTQWWSSNVKASNVDYVGTIDEFRVYGIALTADEMAEILTSVEAPLQSYGTASSTATYDLSGRRVESRGTSTLPRGIYLRGGKKIVR